MISRRQIIRGQQEPAMLTMSNQSTSSSTGQQTSGASSSKSAASSSASSSNQQVKPKSQLQQQRGAGHQTRALMQPTRGQQQVAHQGKLARQANGKQTVPNNNNNDDELHQQDSSDGYVANQYEDYLDERHQVKDYWRRQEAAQNHRQDSNQSAGYRHFDPYSIYGEEDDVWYSEERLFEDHLEEIFNKWRLLDDDIWCKLIIMERNRRIGKAYARVPIVTIDGSHELSYDGYKLALNGFDNHDRDAKTEECRKRIGKGIRIKMDHFGNILIKRLSKSGVYIKEWLQPPAQLNGLGGSSSHGGRSSQLMPSRQQLIKNLNGGGGGAGRAGSQVSAFGTASVTPSSSSSGSSMEPPNDSAICDEVIGIGGRLEQDKIYVMFDIRKFQANITQELCRPYPDKRKLEQQCFSIVGLARDADDILNLPCWVMVINIVAIEMLNERFPLMSHHNHHTSFPDTMLLDNGGGNRRAANQTQPPNFVSIFEQANNNNNGHRHHQFRQTSKDEHPTNKEEDPYSLPANASSSDLKSSINDYGTTSTKNIGSLMDPNGHVNLCSSASRNYYGSKRAEMYAHKKELSARNPPDTGLGSQGSLADLKQRSKSNCNIYGPSTKQLNSNGAARYNNSSSIYSPGHMLVPPPGDSVPPKLPPRDFVKRTKSKSSTNVSYDGAAPKSDLDNECIYSTGRMPIKPSDETQMNAPDERQQVNKMARKTKKNRFLESLKAPLELAKSSSSRSASVLGAPIQQAASDLQLASSDKKAASKSRVLAKSGATKNLRSFLSSSKGANGANKTSKQETNRDDNTFKSGQNNKKDSGESNSALDLNEDIGDDSQQQVAQTNSSTSASYNDLDIPTPDYETDENIYALEISYRGFSPPSDQMKHDNQSGARRSGVNSLGGKNMTNKKAAHKKDDLYYSGYRAHVPNQHGNGGMINGNGKSSNNHDSLATDKITRETSRFVNHNQNGKMMMTAGANAKLNGREMIYGSTSGLSAASMIGSRYRSASMQRHYPRSSQVVRSHNEMYDIDSENLYALGAAHNGTGIDNLSPPGQFGGLGDGHRRRSGSKLAANPYGNGQISSGNLHRVASSMANSNYDIGRSSSGIYGNNSSSSSSDYADWHPQMRKVNSSGYLNSIFKSHMASTGSPIDLFSTNHALNKNQLVASGGGGGGGGAYNNSKHQIKQTRNYLTSRTLKSTPPSSVLSKQQLQQQKHHQLASTIVNGPTYPSYDSSNDSEPSYTNSSDGLDLYDQIGVHTRMNHHHHQFLDLQAAHNLAPEVHVGEWENMYDR